MYTVITVDEATVLIAALSSIIVPFIVSYLKKSSWPNYAKFFLAAGVSLVAGYLTAVATMTSTGVTSSILIGSVILTAAQASYKTWFKGLGLETWFNPPEEKMQEAAEAAGQIAENTVKEVIKDAVEQADTTHEHEEST